MMRLFRVVVQVGDIEAATRFYGSLSGGRSFYGRDPFGNALCFVDSQTAYRGASPAHARIDSINPAT